MQAGSLHTACGAALLDEEHQTMFPGFAFDMARKPGGEASVVKTYFHVPAVLLFPAYRQGVFVEREFGVYDRVRDNFPKYVVTLDEFDMSKNGIKHRNIRDFLLEAEWR